MNIIIFASVAPAGGALSHYTINLLLANLVIAVILPNLVALVTARVAQAPLKAILLMLFSAVSGVASQVVTTNGDFHWKPAFISVAQVFLTAVAVHFGLLKPVGLTGSQGVIQTSLPNGLGHFGGIPPARGDSS